jgi:hypothetical protein
LATLTQILHGAANASDPGTLSGLLSCAAFISAPFQSTVIPYVVVIGVRVVEVGLRFCAKPGLPAL